MEQKQQEEKWLPVVGWEGFYEVSDMGRVRSVDREVLRNGHSMRLRGRILRPAKGAPHTPLSVVLCRDAKLSTKGVHRLVMEAFGGPPPPGMEVLHGPRGRWCNEFSNLSWGTHAQNCGPDMVRDGTAPQGEKNAHAKLTEGDIPSIRSDPRTCSEIAAEYGVHRRTISDVKRRITWKCVPESDGSERREPRPVAKLTETCIPSIRADPRGHAQIARQYGVTKAAISRVKRRITWKHVPE